jgi:hypothetical protein
MHLDGQWTSPDRAEMMGAQGETELTVGDESRLSPQRAIKSFGNEQRRLKTDSGMLWWRPHVRINVGHFRGALHSRLVWDPCFYGHADRHICFSVTSVFFLLFPAHNDARHNGRPAKRAVQGSRNQDSGSRRSVAMP